MSDREHAPGPRGSPQVPQAPDEALEKAPFLAGTAKTESWGDRLLLRHLGQEEGLSFPSTRASNR
jgi:hypothetical protein